MICNKCGNRFEYDEGMSYDNEAFICFECAEDGVMLTDLIPKITNWGKKMTRYQRYIESIRKYNNSEKGKECRKRYYKKNSEKIKESTRKYYEKNSEKIKECRRKYYNKNRISRLTKEREYSLIKKKIWDSLSSNEQLCLMMKLTNELLNKK